MLDEDPINFSFMVLPVSETIVKAMGMLRKIYATNQEVNITDLDRVVVKPPVKAESAASLFLRHFAYCSNEAISLKSMIEATDRGSDPPIHVYLLIRYTTAGL